MEYIIKQTLSETIKRIELANGNIWITKVQLNNKTFFGVGESKKEAEYNLVQKKQYAINAMPPFLYHMGSYNASNSSQKVQSISAHSFLMSMLPITHRTAYKMNVVCSDKAICLIVSDPLNNFKPQYFWTLNISHESLRNCVYEFYIKLQQDKYFFNQKQNKKLGQWMNIWYSKLPSKSLK